jgi:hypothetical protein
MPIFLLYLEVTRQLAGVLRHYGASDIFQNPQKQECKIGFALHLSASARGHTLPLQQAPQDTLEVPRSAEENGVHRSLTSRGAKSFFIQLVQLSKNTSSLLHPAL